MDAIEHYTNIRNSSIAKADRIIAAIQARPGREASEQERQTIRTLTAQTKAADEKIKFEKRWRAYGDVTDLADAMGDGLGRGDLWSAIQAAGLELRDKPTVSVPLSPGMMLAGATWSGDPDGFSRREVQVAQLGADERFLWPILNRGRIDADTTSVSGPRQVSRSFTASAGIRGVAETSPKPEVDTVAELATESVQQIAFVSTQIPNVYFANSTFRSFISRDLAFAWNSAADNHCLAQIAATTAARTRARSRSLSPPPSGA